MLKKRKRKYTLGGKIDKLNNSLAENMTIRQKFKIINLWKEKKKILLFFKYMQKTF
jgi:hypothetical protein